MKVNYKDTLNLPKTDFPMKGNLGVNEPRILSFWNEKKLYERMLEKRKNSNSFILHDGPPYANGNIHMGHALNKILKDIIVKYKFLTGYFSPYVPGWDCHGLPIELKVEENLGKEKKRDIVEFRRECRKYAEKYINVQREEFRRLGVFGDWQNPYLTMDYKYQSKIYEGFINIFSKGYVYRRRKPVYWCTSCTTALAEAEVEYRDKESPSVYIAFQCTEGLRNKFSLPEDSFVVIWTTTPWTIPGNVAIQVNPRFVYLWIKTSKGVILVAKELLKRFEEDTGIKAEKIIKEAKGVELEGFEVKHPIFNRHSLIVLSEFVTLEQGTGCVHTAPGHGEEDYEIGLRYDLKVLSPVDEKGIFTDEAGDFQGKFVFKANEDIMNFLEENGALLGKGKITHSYPHCWRCKNPVIFRATEQWFVSMEHKDLRKKLLEEIERVKWTPHWGKLRIKGMVEVRPDWCISRQRAWGVPIAMLKCTNCGEYLRDEQVFERIVKEIEGYGADIWYEKGAEEFSMGKSCKRCGSKNFLKENDILDVWFDSGISHSIVLENFKGLRWPADLYLEGSDQHRGWFQSSLITSVTTKNSAPYRQVLTHGFVVDGEGKKMAKSQGNVISPQEIIKSYGAEIVRMWTAYENYRDDVRLSREILQRIVESYKKIRNTIRFMLANLYDFKRDESIALEKLNVIDRLAIAKMKDLIKKVKRAYENHEFHAVYHSTYNFAVTFLSSFYFDVLKDTLYCDKKDSFKRKSAQTAIYHILKNYLIIIAPIMSFLAEEAWQYFRALDGKLEESVFLNDFSKEIEKDEEEKEIEKDFEVLFEVRDVVLKELEQKRIEKFIGSSLEAEVVLEIPQRISEIINKYSKILPGIFIVSGVKILESKNNLSVSIEKAEGKKCMRCWNYRKSVGANPEQPDLCERCVEVVV